MTLRWGSSVDNIAGAQAMKDVESNFADVCVMHAERLCHTYASTGLEIKSTFGTAIAV